MFKIKRCKISGNEDIDRFIYDNELKWIPYDEFEDVEYINKGGFGTIYKATWIDNDKKVVLKCFNQPNDVDEDFNKILEEV